MKSNQKSNMKSNQKSDNSERKNNRCNVGNYYRNLTECLVCKEDFFIDTVMITVCQKCNIVYTCKGCGDITDHHSC